MHVFMVVLIADLDILFTIFGGKMLMNIASVFLMLAVHTSNINAGGKTIWSPLAVYVLADTLSIRTNM
ncbi:UNVERIFIED_CONTAM: hypothetical protein K2H54_043660 [Gekko kuhli]